MSVEEIERYLIRTAINHNVRIMLSQSGDAIGAWCDRNTFRANPLAEVF
jgi:hypothetical protein